MPAFGSLTLKVLLFADRLCTLCSSSSLVLHLQRLADARADDARAVDAAALIDDDRLVGTGVCGNVPCSRTKTFARLPSMVAATTSPGRRACRG